MGSLLEQGILNDKCRQSETSPEAPNEFAGLYLTGRIVIHERPTSSISRTTNSTKGLPINLAAPVTRTSVTRVSFFLYLYMINISR